MIQSTNPPPRAQLLVIGPLPPPIAGTSVSFRIFCDIARHYPHLVHLSVIDSAPKELGENPLFTLSNFRVAWNVLISVLTKVRRHSHVLIFSNDRFMLTLASPCIVLAKLLGNKPCYVRAFGGSLDTFERRLSPPARWFLRWALRRADGLIVQTELLQRHFREVLGTDVALVPGYRTVPNGIETPALHGVDDATTPLRLVYISHVREEKGIFDLLEAMRGLHEAEQPSFRLDVYGPVYRESRDRFDLELAQTSNAEYHGVLDPDDVTGILADNDVLVFPSYYKSEGHPGILVESMMAGVAVVATNFRSIPELIDHQVNGLLVTPQRPSELLAAIRLLHEDRELLGMLSKNNLRRRRQYTADRLVPQLFRSLGIELVADNIDSDPEATRREIEAEDSGMNNA